MGDEIKKKDAESIAEAGADKAEIALGRQITEFLKAHAEQTGIIHGKNAHFVLADDVGEKILIRFKNKVRGAVSSRSEYPSAQDKNGRASLQTVVFSFNDIDGIR